VSIKALAATPLIFTGMLSFEEALPVLSGLICISKDDAQLLLDLTDRDRQTLEKCPLFSHLKQTLSLAGHLERS